MAKLINSIIEILQEKQKKLNNDDINFIRSQYHLFSSEEFEDIGFIEEIISQIEITPES